MAARRNANTTVTLASGGTIRFVLDLIDRLAIYAKEHPVIGIAPVVSGPAPKSDGDKAVKS